MLTSKLSPYRISESVEIDQIGELGARNGRFRLLSFSLHFHLQDFLCMCIVST